jgi:molybdopterin converting factor small subunit
LTITIISREAMFFACPLSNLEMKVQVNILANLKQYAPGGKGNFALDLASGATVETLVKILEIPQTVKMIILVNGRRAEIDTPLRDAYEITVFPPVEGG